MEQCDLLLLHAPSIFDFRNKDDILFAFSSSSSISVSPLYEMYPLGFKVIETFLKRKGKKVGIINLADMMLKNPALDVEYFLKSLNAKLFGIDLHWLASAQGSLEIAKLLKEYHPDVPVIFGGISATYFYQELIERPQVDFVLRGVDTTDSLYQLLNQLNNGTYNTIANLCWKDKGKGIIMNDFFNASSYNSPVDWAYSGNDINYFMVFSGAGCEYNCTFCSGSRYSMMKHQGVEKGFINKETPVFLQEIASIKDRSCSNTTLITLHHWFEDKQLLKKVLDVLEASNIRRIHFTLFHLLPEDHVHLLSGYHMRPYFELSIQSSSERIRRLCGNPDYSNSELELWLDYLFAHNKAAIVAVFFMIGLPEQTEEHVMEDLDYADYLMGKYGKYNLDMYISPMRPFLDPGSHIYDNPEQYGYRIFFHHLEDYEKAVMSPHWRDSMNYETRWLSRDDIVQITYKALKKTVVDKGKHNKLPGRQVRRTVEKIDYTVDLLERIGNYTHADMPDSLRKEILHYNNQILGSHVSQRSPLDMKFYKYWYE